METEMLPSRMFAKGEEPVGIKVTAYHKPGRIISIMNALEDDEADVIRNSSFGKFVSLAEKPTYSGRFGRFIMSRQLKTLKNHEIWILFAGSPIRFSLREFAIVTGLPCGKFPTKSKKKLKNNIAEKPYWPTLFGKLQSVTVASVVRILQRKTVTDKELRIKYACLVLLASVLMPTTHHPKIIPEHAEEIKDLDSFFSYPWGRLAFDMLMSSIKERNEISLSQKIVALKGFVQALQLVMIEAVPALNEGVQANCASDSESDDDVDKEDDKGSPRAKLSLSLNPGHARDVHEACEVEVDCIISDDGENEVDEETFCWPDEVVDTKVDYMVGLINQDFRFTSDMFVGGATKADVERMRKEADERESKNKSKKGAATVDSGQHSRSGEGGFINEVDVVQIADLVASKVKEDIRLLDEKLSTNIVKVEELKTAVTLMEYGIRNHVDDKIKTMGDAIIASIAGYIGKFRNGEVNNCGQKEGVNDCSEVPICPEQMQSTRADGTSTLIGSVIRQLAGDGNGSTQFDNSCTTNSPHDVAINVDVVNDIIGGKTSRDFQDSRHQPMDRGVEGQLEDPEGFNNDVTAIVSGVDNIVHGVGNCRKSKRQKTAPQMLVADYQCDNRFMQVGRDGGPVKDALSDQANITGKYALLHEMFKKCWSLNVGGLNLSNKELAELCGRTKSMSLKLMDALVHHIRGEYDKAAVDMVFKKAAFLDTKFASLLGKNYPKFSKVNNKECFKFQQQLVDFVNGDENTNIEAERFYFPFNFDKQHWVAICADWPSKIITILDCNVCHRSESAMAKDISPIAEMFPYLLQQFQETLCLSWLRGPRMFRRMVFMLILGLQLFF